MINYDKISISLGNPKCNVHSFSFPACITCNPEAPCFKLCYARKAERLYSATAEAYARNLRIWNEIPRSLEAQIVADCLTQAFFRWFVSGDIVSADFFVMMVRIAKKCKNCKFLAFTKQYDIVNSYVDAGGKIPKNLKIVFSQWGNFGSGKNPHAFPESQVIFKGEPEPQNVFKCGGKCSDCICRGVGCWTLRKGQRVYFDQH